MPSAGLVERSAGLFPSGREGAAGLLYALNDEQVQSVRLFVAGSLRRIRSPRAAVTDASLILRCSAPAQSCLD